MTRESDKESKRINNVSNDKESKKINNASISLKKTKSKH